METLSRKEQLAAYKREKALAAKQQPSSKMTRKSSSSNKENTAAQKVTQTSKQVAKKPLQPTKSAAMSNKEKMALKAQRAGAKSVAPNTPIGKLKQRLQTALTPKAIAIDTIEPIPMSEQLQSAIPVDITSELRTHILQGSALYECSVTSGRAYFSDIPTEPGMTSIVKLPLYWLSWAKLEEKYKEFEFAESLYVRAMGLVEGKAAQSAIKVAYDAHLVQAEEAYAQCLDKLLPDTKYSNPSSKSKEVQHFVPKTISTSPNEAQAATQRKSEHHSIGGVFQDVNVAETRRKFETRATQSIANSSIVPPQGRVSELSSELMNKPLRALNLPGAVPLPGLASSIATVKDEPQGADLNLLLGIYGSQTPAKPSTPPTVQRVESHSATKRSSLQELLDDAQDARTAATCKPRGRAHAPVYIAAEDISDDDSYAEPERVVPDVSTEHNTVANTVLACPVKAIVKPLRKRTRKVNFTETGEAKEDPGKASKKRKGTPFKPPVVLGNSEDDDMTTDNIACADASTPIRRRSRRLSRSSDF